MLLTLGVTDLTEKVKNWICSRMLISIRASRSKSKLVNIFMKRISAGRDWRLEGGEWRVEGREWRVDIDIRHTSSWIECMLRKKCNQLKGW